MGERILQATRSQIGGRVGNWTEHGQVSVSGRGHRTDRDLAVGLPLAMVGKLQFELRKDGRRAPPWGGLRGVLEPSMERFLKRQPAQNGVTCAEPPSANRGFTGMRPLPLDLDLPGQHQRTGSWAGQTPALPGKGGGLASNNPFFVRSLLFAPSPAYKASHFHSS